MRDAPLLSFDIRPHRSGEDGFFADLGCGGEPDELPALHFGERFPQEPQALLGVGLKKHPEAVEVPELPEHAGFAVEMVGKYLLPDDGMAFRTLVDLEEEEPLLGIRFVPGGDDGHGVRISVTSERATFCYKTFSPEYQQKVAVERAAEAKERSDTARQTAEAGRAAYCADELTRVRGQCERQAQLAQETDRDEIIRLTMLLSGERDKHEKDLQDVMAKSAPRSGIRLFRSFPAADESALLVIFGCFAVTAGFFLGWPGRSRGARRDAGAVSAMIALGVYLVSVALLPDTRFGELLFAATAAVLVVAFRALARSQLELRQSGQAPSSP